MSRYILHSRGVLGLNFLQENKLLFICKFNSFSFQQYGVCWFLMIFYTWLMFKWKHDFTWPHVTKKLSSHIHCLRTFLMHIHNLCSYANRSSSHPGSWSVYCEMFCCDCSPRLVKNCFFKLSCDRFLKFGSNFPSKNPLSYWKST